jgi:hypothetical protein
MLRKGWRVIFDRDSDNYLTDNKSVIMSDDNMEDDLGDHSN